MISEEDWNRAKELEMAGKIIVVYEDVFDALQSSRPRSEAMSKEDGSDAGDKSLLRREP